jgi:hypothetical protein
MSFFTMAGLRLKVFATAQSTSRRRSTVASSRHGELGVDDACSYSSTWPDTRHGFGGAVFGDFFLIEKEGVGPVRGERLAFGETNGRNEAWLRDTLLRHPELIPVRDIDPAYGPLTPLCAELQLGVGVGRLDAVFINPFGRLTLVECKLWRNPKARREVVAQVLDYARAISRWSYSDLQRQVASATGRTGNVPYELAKVQHPELIEHDFVDATAASMRAGRFLLLIAATASVKTLALWPS